MSRHRRDLRRRHGHGSRRMKGADGEKSAHGWTRTDTRRGKEQARRIVSRVKKLMRHAVVSGASPWGIKGEVDSAAGRVGGRSAGVGTGSRGSCHQSIRLLNFTFCATSHCPGSETFCRWNARFTALVPRSAAGPQGELFFFACPRVRLSFAIYNHSFSILNFAVGFRAQEKELKQ